MDKNRLLAGRRERRRNHVRNRLRGTQEQPRLCVVRSLKHLSVQIIDDENNRTLVSASTKDKGLRDDLKVGGNCDAATKLGKVVAERALAAGIKTVKFDRGASRYHGRLAALADAAREGGLAF